MASRTAIFSFLVLTFAAGQAYAEDILKNGGFDKGFEDWNTDYAWTGNKHYVGNKDRVSIVDRDGTRKNIAKISPAGDAGAKIESIPIKFEPGYRYTCELDVKGGPYRIYFAGYKWKPGIRPHDKPKLGELRMIYKSKASAASAGSWKKEKLELPGVKLSAQAKKHLKYVRYVTVYVWMMKGGSIDNVRVTKRKDPSVKF